MRTHAEESSSEQRRESGFIIVTEIHISKVYVIFEIFCRIIVPITSRLSY